MQVMHAVTQHRFNQALKVVQHMGCHHKNLTCYRGHFDWTSALTCHVDVIAAASNHAHESVEVYQLQRCRHIQGIMMVQVMCIKKHA